MRKLLLALTFASCCHAAVALVQTKNCSGNNGTTGSSACSFTSLPTVGNLVIALGGVDSGASISASDNQGHTYTSLINSSGADSTRSAMYAVVVATSSGTFTVTMANATGTILAEFSGVTGGINIDASATGNIGSGGGAGPPCGAGMTTTVSDLLLTGMYEANSNVAVDSIGSGTFPYVIPANGTQVNPILMGFSWLAAGAGSYNADWVLHPGFNMGNGSAVCAALKTSASAPAKVVHRVIN